MRHRRLFAVLGTLVFFTAGCGGGDRGSGDQRLAEGATFSFALSADPGNLDPGMSVLQITNFTLRFAYDTLVQYDADGKIVSGLAEKWGVTPNAVTYTLRKGVTCSDGSPLTASQVAENFTWVADPKNKSPLLGVYVPKDASAKGDDAAGTVTVSTAAPFGFLLESTASVWIACGKGLADRSLMAKSTSGSGPYTLTEAVPSDHYTFTVREDYAWGPGGSTTKDKGVPRTVILKVVPNEATAANLIISGDLNAALFTGPDRDRVKALPGAKPQSLPSSIGQFFYHQGSGHPGADPAVRQALTRGVNLDELGKIIGQNTGKQPTGLVTIPPCAGDTVGGNRPTYDVNAAKSALDAAGWTAGADGVRAKNGQKLNVRLLYGSTGGPALKAGMEYLAEEWKKLGVAVELKPVVDTKFSESLFATGDWDVGWVPIGTSMPSQLVSFLSGATPPNGSNFANLNNADYNRLVEQARGTVGEPGCKLWNDAETALVKAGDVVPVVAQNIELVARNAQVPVVRAALRPNLIRMLEG